MSEQTSDWIPVTDFDPARDEIVWMLMHNDDDEPVISLGVRSAYGAIDYSGWMRCGGVHYECGEWNYSDADWENLEPTHFMRLPALPTMGGDG